MAMEGALQRARALAANPAAAAMMLAATRHKAETAVQDVSNDRAEREKGAEVTVDMGTGTMTAKGVPIDDFEAAQQAAYDKPYDELGQVVSPILDMFKARAQLLRPDKIKQQLSTRAGRLRAARDEFDYNALTSRVAGAWQVGRLPEDVAVQRIQERRAAKLAKDYAAVSPLIDDERQQARADAGVSQQQRTAGRQRRKDVYTDIGKADLDLLTLEGIAARTGVDPEELRADPEVMGEIKDRREKLTLKLAKDTATERRKRVAGLKRDEVEGGGSFEQWRTDTEMQVGELTESETRQARAKWRSFEDKVSDEQEREAAKMRAEARAIAAQERAADAAERSASAADRAERGEQRAVVREQSSERRRSIERLGSEIDQTYDRIQQNSLKFTTAKKDSERAELQRQNRELTQKQRKLYGQLTALRGDKTAASAPAPVAATVKPAGGATAATAAAPTTYSPRIEAGIAAYMQAKGYGRDKRAVAIEELRKAGKIK